MKLSDEHSGKIERFALEYYRGLDYLHGEDHANRTVKLAEFIAENEGGDKRLVRLGALIHQFHDREDVLEEFLKKINVPSETIAGFLSIVKCRPHRQGIKAKNLTEKIIYDADALQCLCPFGTLRLFAERVPKHEDLVDTVEQIKEVQSKFFNNLQTDTARKLADRPQRLVGRFFKLFEEEFRGYYR